MPKPDLPMVPRFGGTAMVPRRICVDQFTPAEKAIWDAVAIVEAAGASVALTDAVMLLSMAREKVADHVDGMDSGVAAPATPSLPPGAPDERDALAQLVDDHRYFSDSGQRCADAIMAAGWSRGQAGAAPATEEPTEEPVAWAVIVKGNVRNVWHREQLADDEADEQEGGADVMPLYPHPPQGSRSADSARLALEALVRHLAKSYWGPFDVCGAIERFKVAEYPALSSPPPATLDQPTPTAYRHKNQLTGQWIYTESRCPSEWAERDGIVQEPLYLSGAAPATPSTEAADDTKRLDWLNEHGEEVTLGIGGTEDDGFWFCNHERNRGGTPRRAIDVAMRADSDLPSSPSGASGTEEGKFDREKFADAAIEAQASGFTHICLLCFAGINGEQCASCHPIASAPAGEEPSDWRQDAKVRALHARLYTLLTPVSNTETPEPCETLIELLDAVAALHSRSPEKPSHA